MVVKWKESCSSFSYSFERQSLDADEEAFWRDMIIKYLTPIAVDPEEQTRIRQTLTDLRNKVSVTV